MVWSRSKLIGPLTRQPGPGGEPRRRRSRIGWRWGGWPPVLIVVLGKGLQRTCVRHEDQYGDSALGQLDALLRGDEDAGRLGERLAVQRAAAPDGHLAALVRRD